MKKEKLLSKLMRFACAFLALLTVMTALPFFAVEADAATTVAEGSVTYEFNGDADTALAVADLNSSDGKFTGRAVSGVGYIKDPENSDNTVIGQASSSTNAQFTVGDVNYVLTDSLFSVEAKIYVDVDANGNAMYPSSSLSLFAFHSADNNFPMVLLESDGYLSLRPSNYSSSTGYTKTAKQLSVKTWYNVKVYLDTASSIVSLYVDGTLVKSLKMKSGDVSEIDYLRFFNSSKSSYGVYMDDLSIASCSFNEVIRFDELGTGVTATSTNLTGLVSSDSSVETGGTIVTTEDPDDASNVVAHNTSNEMLFFVKDPELLIPKSDFVVSADFRFAKFPVSASDGSSKPTSLLCWVCNSNDYNIFCRVDGEGNLLDINNNITGIVLEKDTWVNISAHVDVSSGAYRVYVDGKYAFKGAIGSINSDSMTSSYIRVLNQLGTASFDAYVDDIQVYRLAYAADSTFSSDGVIWDVDFNGFGEGATLDTSAWSGLSDVANSYWCGISSKSSVVTFNGSKALKVSGVTQEQMLDLFVGNGDFDPLKNGTVKLSFDFTMESDEDTDGTHNLVRWRRIDLNGETKYTDILNLLGDNSLKFCGNATGYTLELGKLYKIEIIFNSVDCNGSRCYDTTLVINEETVFDAYPNWSSNTMFGENGMYILDDAGIKRYMPYTGLVKSYIFDKSGNLVTDADGNYVYIDKFVSENTANPDMLRMFQGCSGGSGMVYYVDNLKIEAIDTQPLFGTDFTGWSNFNLGTSNTDYRYNIGGAAIVTEDGNTYAQLPVATAQKHFFLGDNYNYYLGKDILFETDIYLSQKSDTTVNAGSLVTLLMHKEGTVSSPFGWSGSGTQMTLVIRADGNGNIYQMNNSTNPIGQLKAGGWTKLGIQLYGNEGCWTEYDIYINNVLVFTGTLDTSFQKNAGCYAWRLTNINNVNVGYDNISISAAKRSIDDLYLDFENETEQNEALVRIGSGWQYGAIGATRTDSEGNTVKTTEILGDEGAKYLRVNHQNLTGSLNAYIDVYSDKFIDEDAYLLETSVRYTANTGYSLKIAEIYDPDTAESATVLSVRGDTNKLFITLRGVQYDLTDKAGNLLYAAKTADAEFTDIAILIDSVKKTYTVYVDGKLAYYTYDGKSLPCADMPLYFASCTSISSSESLIRMLEIPNVKYSDGTVDIDYVNVISLSNGLGTEIKGSQTRAVLAEATFDVRFVSGLDTLYGSAVGFEISADYTDKNGSYTKSYDISSLLVFAKVSAGTGEITAAELESSYLAAIEIYDIPMDITVEFTALPYIDHGGVKIYGKAYTATFTNGEIVE